MKSTRIAIVADSGCDLPLSLLQRYRILQEPLLARFGEYELRDSPETRDEFWERYDISQPPQSSGPSVGEWQEVFQQALQMADEVIAITITGKHSSTFNTAVIAAREFAGRIHVFASWSLSLGEGLLTLKAAEMAAAGATAKEILETLHDWRQRLHITIFLDTIEAVQRGGRLAPVMAAIKRVSAVLSIKPILTMNEGELNFAGAVRTLKKGMARAVRQVQGQKLLAAAVAHTRIPEVANRLADMVSASTDLTDATLLVAEAGPALAVHAGPGAFGLAYVVAQESSN